MRRRSGRTEPSRKAYQIGAERGKSTRIALVELFVDPAPLRPGAPRGLRLRPERGAILRSCRVPSPRKVPYWQPPKSRKKAAPPDPARDVLGAIRIVMVEPSGPRNVGSTARAIKNFGFSRLVLVNPPPIDDPECLEMGTNAHDVLRNARIVASLDEALAGAGLVVGTTARPRHRVPTRTPGEAAAEIVAAARSGEVAILFGRERTGLTSEELARCQLVLSIRTGDDHASLNVAQAVLVVAYEVFGASGAHGVVAAAAPGRVLTDEMRRRLEDELMRACEKLGVTKGETRGAFRKSIERLLAAGPIQTRDARVMFALARHAQQIAAPDDPGARPPRRPRPR
jgi:TrmH family RNA methyltransferase